MSEGGGMSERDIATRHVINELKQLYKDKLLPLEESFKFDYFYSPPMTDSEFESKPQVLLVGQYSVGKTSFIRYLLGQDFPGARIGPEPTTDRFVAVLHAEDDKVIPGNALCVSSELPFRGLERFGMGFLNKFEGSALPNKVLENITLIDTPGILSGSKQRDDRGYNFEHVCRWFAERCDLILLLFDANKLDISDEFRAVIESFRGNDDKVRCILNKADTIDRQRLMRVYGALMWQIGKVLRTPEVLRVYIGSFWDQPLMFEDLAHLFEQEENDLMSDLRDLPRNSAVRKINELVKRARLAKVNAQIISYLRGQMPALTGKAKKQQDLIRNLDQVFRSVMSLCNLPPGDFPDIDQFRSKLHDLNFSKFNKIKQRQLDLVEELLTLDIPRLMDSLPRQLFDRSRELPPEAIAAAPPPPPTVAPAFWGGHPTSGAAAEPDFPEARLPTAPPTREAPPAAPVAEAVPPPAHEAPTISAAKPNPFAKAKSNPFAKPALPEWPVREKKAEYDVIFDSFGPVNGRLDGDKAKDALVATGLEMDALFAVWELADHGADGELDEEEFAVAMYLVDKIKSGEELPPALSPDMIPPSQR